MIKEYENTLRTIIGLVLGYEDNTDYGITVDRIEKWKERREIEKKKRDEIQIENRLIFYSDFYDLRVIIIKFWEKFKPILHDKKKFEVFNKEIEDYRDTIAHGREIFSFQSQLLEGIVGNLKNQLVLFHSKNSSPDDFFVKLLKVTDNFGSIWEQGNEKLVATKKVLRVNDKLEFIVEAFDPKGRGIEYYYKTMPGEFNEIRQDRKSFAIVVSKKMISKNMFIDIRVKIKDEDYESSDSTLFEYTVLP